MEDNPYVIAGKKERSRLTGSSIRAGTSERKPNETTCAFMTSGAPMPAALPLHGLDILTLYGSFGCLAVGGSALYVEEQHHV
jgi:hypothetical protein